MKVLVASDLASITDKIATAHIGGAEVSVDRVSDCFQADQRLRTDGKELDVIVLHVPSVSEANLRSAFSTISRSRGKPAAIVLPHKASPSTVWRCIVNGAGAVLTDDMPSAAMGHLLSLMHTGLRIPTLNEDVLPDPSVVAQKLSDRELQVLAGVCKGLQNKEIAHDFNIKEVTVKMHVRAVIRKLDAKNRTHAAMIARDLGLVG